MEMCTAETTKAGSSERQRRRRVIPQSTLMFLLLKQEGIVSASPDPHNKLHVLLCSGETLLLLGDNMSAADRILQMDGVRGGVCAGLHIIPPTINHSGNKIHFKVWTRLKRCKKEDG